VSEKCYGCLGIKTIANIHLNSIGLTNEPFTSFEFPFPHRMLGDFCSFLLGIIVVLFLHKENIKYIFWH
jgi:hypothetical protein